MSDGFNASVELWSVANVVTGFAVAQGLAFALAVGGDLVDLQSASPCAKGVITALSIGFGASYSFAIQRCRILAAPAQEFEAIWHEVTYGRHAAVWAFTLLAVFALYAPELIGSS